MANTTLACLSSTLHTRFQIPVGIREREAGGLFATGIASVDEVLHGGLHRGALNEVSGAASSNRTSLTVSVLAEALAAGECAAWIDASGTFDPESAAESGLQLDRLLWINCHGQPEHALKSTDLLLHGGGFGLMVLDMADVPESVIRRVPLASWFRLRNAAEETGTALIVMTPVPQTRSCAAVCVELSRKKSLWRGRILRGLASQLQTRKHSGCSNTSFESGL